MGVLFCFILFFPSVILIFFLAFLLTPLVAEKFWQVTVSRGLWQIAFSLLEEQRGKNWMPDDYISFVDLLADERYCGRSAHTFCNMLLVLFRLILSQSMSSCCSHQVTTHVKIAFVLCCKVF